VVIAGLGASFDLVSEVTFWSFLFSGVILLLIAGSRSAWFLLTHE
jgi:hypothetical protein